MPCMQYRPKSWVVRDQGFRTVREKNHDSFISRQEDICRSHPRGTSTPHRYQGTLPGNSLPHPSSKPSKYASFGFWTQAFDLTKNYTKPATPADNLTVSAWWDLRITGGGDSSSVIGALALAHTRHWVPMQHHMNWPAWYSAVIPELRLWKQEVHTFKVFLGYTVSWKPAWTT